MAAINMNRQTAEYINDLMLDLSAKVSNSVGTVKDNCSDEEIKKYRKPASHILALTFDILDIVHEQYPDLKPADFED